MAQSFDPVFGDWHSENCIGIGTDGRVYTVIKNNEDGSVSRSILKTIRLSENRNEGKGYNILGDYDSAPSDEGFEQVIKKITDNIQTVMEKDGGKRFVKYEQWEVRDASDSRGKVILIRLEEMRSLAAVLTHFSFTHNEVVNLGISICRSLIGCREIGYIYPNLKPENILFNSKGVCKLGDFGSFSCLENSKTSIAYKKTQYYRAPEFLKSGKINSTCDTYSLGLVLYMLTNRGSLPFCEMYPQEVTVNGLNRSVERRMNGDELPKPVLASDGLYRIIKKACAFSEKDRYLTPNQMLSDLKNLLLNKPFEETKYDDLYSKSGNKKDTDENEQAALQRDKPNTQQSPVQEESKPTDGDLLENKIKVPDVSAKDYFDTAKIDRKRKKGSPTVTPFFNKKKKKPSAFSQSDIIKITVALFFAVLVLVMIVASLVMRSNLNKDEIPQTSEAAVVYNIGGVDLWQLK